jgi:plastocyanin
MDRRTLIATAGIALFGGCVGGGSDSESPSGSGTDSGTGQPGSESDADADADLEEIRAEADAVIVMTNEPAFEPRVAEIDAGGTVAWINESTISQSVTADEGGLPEGAEYFASGGSERETIASLLYPLRGVVEPGEAFTHTFETPGVYEYYSIRSEHRGMAGRVVVG